MTDSLFFSKKLQQLKVFCFFIVIGVSEKLDKIVRDHPFQFVIFKPLSYCFKETKGFDVNASFASRP